MTTSSSPFPSPHQQELLEARDPISAEILLHKVGQGSSRHGIHMSWIFRGGCRSQGSLGRPEHACRFMWQGLMMTVVWEMEAACEDGLGVCSITHCSCCTEVLAVFWQQQPRTFPGVFSKAEAALEGFSCTWTHLLPYWETHLLSDEMNSDNLPPCPPLLQGGCGGWDIHGSRTGTPDTQRQGVAIPDTQRLSVMACST